MKRNINIPCLLVLILFALSCHDSFVPVAKPRMYPKVVFPERNFTNLVYADCDFSFEYPSYLSFKKDSIRFEENYKYPCWFDLHSQELNTSIHFSFLPVRSQKDLDRHITDAFKLVDEHNIKALSRRESVIEDRIKKKYGLIFEMDGDVAAPLQFFITDSVNYFVRASLYFNDKVNQDSTQVVYDFVKKDIDHVIQTFSWKND